VRRLDRVEVVVGEGRGGRVDDERDTGRCNRAGGDQPENRGTGNQVDELS
jgi:hypothetical protein